MARTTNTEVKSIMDTALEDSEIDAIIEYANRMVTNTLGSEGLTDQLLTDIETYLTAHFIAVSKERQTVWEKVLDTWISYTGKFGMYLQMTTFGQMVLMWDSTGKFANIGKQKVKIRATPQYPDNYTTTS